jgi:hypothetical protein
MESDLSTKLEALAIKLGTLTTNSYNIAIVARRISDGDTNTLYSTLANVDSYLVGRSNKLPTIHTLLDKGAKNLSNHQANL